MGVYIPNMKMPEHCGVCRFAVDGWCYAYGKPNIDALANEGRTNFCPLIPVPPHGRLISAKRIEFELCESTMPKKYREFCRRVIRSESLSPTVIPAEEGET